MLELLKVFTAYIAMTTGAPELGHMPKIEYWDNCVMAGKEEGCTLEGPHIGAMYIIPMDTIVLPKDFDASNVQDVSILLHELVHAQQRLDPRMYGKPCIELELQAYRVQMGWLENVVKVKPSDVIGWERPMDGAIASCSGL